MKTLRCLVGATLIAFSLYGHVFAQEPTEIVTADLLTVSINGNVSGLYYLSEGEVKTMEAFEVGMGSAIAYKGPRLLQLYKQAAHVKPVAKGEEKPKPVAQAMLPTSDRVMLIFSFKKRGSKVPDLKAVSVATDKIKEGDYQVFNNSQKTCYLMLDEEKVGLKPGQSRRVSKATWRKDILDLEVKLGVLGKEGEPQIVYSSIWGHRPQRRMFLFLFDNPDRNRPVQIRKLYDVPSVKAITSGSKSRD